MKTDTETLRKRGFLTNTEAEPYFLYSKEELLELLKDKTAVNRTAALFILRMNLMKSYLECWLKKKPYILN